MIILGLALWLLGYLLGIPPLTTIGWVLIVVGIVLLILGVLTGGPIGPRRWYF